MKIFKTITALLVICAFAFSFSACCCVPLFEEEADDANGTVESNPVKSNGFSDDYVYETSRGDESDEEQENSVEASKEESAWDEPEESSETVEESSEPVVEFDPNREWVVDAIAYEKKIIDPVWGADLGEHTCYIPKINSLSDSLNVYYFNEKIYNEYYPVYETLVNGTEDKYIFWLSYDYFVCNGVVAIWVEDIVGYQYSESGCDYKAYYYDIVNDQELTFDQYLNAMGINRAQLENYIFNSDEYVAYCNEWVEGSADNAYLSAAVADEDKIIFFVKNIPGPLNDYAYFEIENNLF